MGWNSWKTFGKSYTHSTVEAQTNALLAQVSGLPAGTTLASLGYNTLAMDSGWRDESGTDSHGFAKADSSKFPSGIPGIASYVHGKGLKLGIYLTPGILKAGYDGKYPIDNTLNPSTGKPYTTQDIVVKPLTNGNTENSSGASYSYQLDFTKPGAAQWIQNYADMLASWGVDYVMWDFVGPGGGNISADDRANMQQWLIATQATPAGSRPIWIKLSNSLKFANAATWEQVSNSWRIDGDVHGTWSDVSSRYSDSPQWAPFEGPGGWGDMDSLLVGQANNYASTNERRTAVTLWSICCSPLILGQDLTKLNSGDIPLITNTEVIAVDQAGHVATPGKTSGVWRAKNPDGSYTVGIFNMGSGSATIACSFSNDLSLSGSATVRDLWTHTDLGTFSGSFSSGSLASHACRLLKITPTGTQQQAAAPVFTPGGDTYTTTQSVTVTSATGGANIRYTTDGVTTPSETVGTLYSGPVSISTTTTLKAIAYASGFTDSNVTTATYTISTGGGPIVLEAENLSPAGSGATVSISNDANASGGVIEFLNSTAAGQSITFTTPGIAAGTYQVQLRYKTNTSRGQHNVVIDGTQVGGTVDQYATTSAYATATLGNVTLSGSGTHTIVMNVTGKNASATQFYVTADTFTFTPINVQPQAAAPVFSPGAGTYSTAQNVTISTTTGGATIRYTTDGSTPSETNGAIYSGPVNISTTTSLQAIAFASGFTDSNVTGGTYTINIPQVATPVFSPASGTPPLSVTITTTTGGATIRYTTDGSTPSETNGTIYPGTAITINSPTTVQAIAYEAGFIDSPLTSATYSVTPPTFNLEAESLSPVGSGATVSISNDANASGGVIEFLNSTAAGQTMTFTTPSMPAGTYAVQLRYKSNTTRGQHTVTIDGMAMGVTIDQFATTSTYVTVSLGNVTLATSGAHTIVMNVTGKNSAATQFYITADKFTFVGQ